MNQKSKSTGFDWEKWGARSSDLISQTGLQENPDPTMQSVGDITSYASTGAAMGGPAGAAIGAGIGVVKSVFNVANARKARRSARRAKERRDRRLDHMRQQELQFRKSRLAAEREGLAYNRQQDLNRSRIEGANTQYSKIQNMMNDNKEFRRMMIQNGYA